MIAQLPSYILFLIPFISSLVGYITNWVAIKMLFRPLREKRLFGIRIPFTPGLIPRKRMDLAESIGRSIAEHLVTRESIAQRIDDDEVKARIELMVYDYSKKLLARDLGSLNSLIPEDFQDEWEKVLSDLNLKVNQWVYDLLEEGEIKDLIQTQIRKKMKELATTPINEVVPKEVLNDLPNLVANSIKSVTEGEELELHLKSFIDRKVDSILEEDKPIGSYLTENLKEAAYAKMEDFLPFMVDRLIQVLEDEQIRKRIKIYLYDLVDKLITETFDENSVWDQLKLGLMESFIMTTEEMKLRIDQGVDEGIPQITKVMKQPEVKSKIYQSLVNSIDSFLQKRISELEIKGETIDELKDNAKNALLGLIKGEKTRRYLSGFLKEKIDQYSTKSAQEIIPSLSQKSVDTIPRGVSDYLMSFLKEESTRQDLSNFFSRQLEKLAQKPIGKISDYISERSIEKGREKATDHLIQLLKRETPKIVEAINISDMVSEKVREFSPQNMERLVLGVTGNQLKAITWFGAILGFFIGIIQIGIILFGMR